MNLAVAYNQYEDDVYPTVEDIKGDLLTKGEFSYGGHSVEWCDVMERLEDQNSNYLLDCFQTGKINTLKHFEHMQLIEKTVQELAEDTETSIKE